LRFFLCIKGFEVNVIPLATKNFETYFNSTLENVLKTVAVCYLEVITQPNPP
jgi:hypothetical protein